VILSAIYWKWIPAKLKMGLKDCSRKWEYTHPEPMKVNWR
jgi:hypothetical protein